jgi:hypothetical protein
LIDEQGGFVVGFVVVLVVFLFVVLLLWRDRLCFEFFRRLMMMMIDDDFGCFGVVFRRVGLFPSSSSFSSSVPVLVLLCCVLLCSFHIARLGHLRG